MYQKVKYTTTFLGIRQQHSYDLYKVIDSVLLDNPQINNFIEIGTGNAALTVILGLHAFLKGTRLLTLDTNDSRPGFVRLKQLLDQLDVYFCKLDCFSKEALREIRLSIAYSSTFLFCDGDDKPKEINTFSKLLKPNSIIAAHDFGYEICRKDVDEKRLEPLVLKEWNKVQTCFYKVVKDDEH